MELLQKLIKFGIVGIIGMCIDFTLTWFFKEKIRINKYVANTIGFSTAAVNNFCLNYYWTFNSEERYPYVLFFKFLLFAVIGLGLNNLIIYLINGKQVYQFYFSKVVATGCVFLWNFLTNNFLNF